MHVNMIISEPAIKIIKQTAHEFIHELVTHELTLQAVYSIENFVYFRIRNLVKHIREPFVNVHEPFANVWESFANGHE